MQLISLSYFETISDKYKQDIIKKCEDFKNKLDLNKNLNQSKGR